MTLNPPAPPAPKVNQAARKVKAVALVSSPVLLTVALVVVGFILGRI